MSKNSNIAIISPSGNLYGSEKVLLDFLTTTKNSYDVWLPKGKLHKKLGSEKKHQFFLFSSVKLLYIKLGCLLIIGKYRKLYINEAGHIKYIKILAKLFPNREFVVHIRLKEDAEHERIGYLQANIKLIVISKYIGSLVEKLGLPYAHIYDPFKMAMQKLPITTNISGKRTKIKLGIVGRVTPSKGLAEILSFVRFLNYSHNSRIELNFFGDVEKDKVEVREFIKEIEELSYVKLFFIGFTSSITEIYNSIDLVVHFNHMEPLGRITFETIWFGKPFFGFTSGGTGELCHCLGLQKFLVILEKGWEQNLLNKIESFANANNENYDDVRKAQNIIESHFTVEKYTQGLEKILDK